MRCARTSLPLVAVLALAMTAGAAETPSSPVPDAQPAESGWPQFRGPARDGVSPETGLLTRWPEEGPREVWRRPLGEGFSGIAITGGRAFTLYSAESEERLIALDPTDGSTLWELPLGRAWKDRFGNGPRSTPTVAGEVVYALGSRGALVAAAVADGSLRWRRELVEDVDARVPQWGVATSPLVEGELLIVNAGGRRDASVVAFDRATGAEVWRALGDGAGYAAPLMVTVGEMRQVVVFTAGSVVALDPNGGDALWSVPWSTSYDVNAATPLFVPPDRLFVSSGYDVGAALFRVAIRDGRPEAERLWASRVMKNQFSSSVLVDGHIYGFDDKTFKCIGVADGEERWRSRGLGHGSLIVADGHLLVLGDRGQLALVRATPDTYREIDRTRVVDGKSWTPPSLADGRLYIRDQREIVSLQIAE